MTDRLGNAELELSTNQTGLDRGLAEAKRKSASFVTDVAASLRRAGQSMRAAGYELTTAVTLPVIAAGSAIVNTGRDFDNSIRRIAGLTGVAKGEIDQMRDSVFALAKEVGRSPVELANALYFIVQPGMKAADALAILEASAKAAASGLGDTQTIAYTTTAAVSAFAKQNLTAAAAVDVLIAGVREGLAEPEDFAAALGQVVGSAAQIGATFPDVVAAISAMTRAGLTAQEAAVSLNQVFVTLFKPTTEAQKALDGYGLSAAKLREIVAQQGLLPALTLLATKFGDNEEAASAVFGNVRALRGVLNLLGQDTTTVAGIFGRVNEATGSLATAFGATEGPGRAMGRALADIQIELIRLSDDVLPVVVDIFRSAAGFVHGLVDGFRALPEPVRAGIVQILALGAALGPLLVVFGALTSALGRGVAAVAAIAGAMGAAKTASVGWIAVLGPLIPLLGLVAYHIDKIQQLGSSDRDAGLKVIDDTKWIAEHPGIPLIFRGLAEAIGLVKKESEDTGAAVDGVARSLSDVELEARDAVETHRILAQSLPKVGKAYNTMSGDVDAWRKKLQADLDAAIASQRDYTSQALALLRQFRKDIEDAYAAAQDAQLDAERTAVAIAQKQIELNELDREYTKNHEHWTKRQTADWRLRKDEALAQMSALKLHLALIGDETAQVAGIKGLLASKEMKDGLTSKFPETRAAYRALRDELITKLNEIGKRGGPASKDAAQTVAKYLNPANPVSPFNDAYQWGTNTGNAFIGALTHALRVTPEMRAAMGRIGGFLEADSPPKDPTNALHHIDKWGAATARGWLEPFVATIRGTAGALRPGLAEAARVLAAPISTPGLSLAGVGIGDGLARPVPTLPAQADAAQATAGGDTFNLYLPDARHTDPWAVLDRVPRYAKQAKAAVADDGWRPAS